MLAKALPEVLEGDERERFDERTEDLESEGVPGELARRVAAMPSLLATFDIVEVGRAIEREPETVMKSYFQLGSRLELNLLREQILALPRENRWQALARAALRDDLNTLHRALTQEVLSEASEREDSEAAINAWMGANAAALERCLGMLRDIKAARVYDTTTLPVALREIRNLIRGGILGGSAGAESFTLAG